MRSRDASEVGLVLIPHVQNRLGAALNVASPLFSIAASLALSILLCLPASAENFSVLTASSFPYGDLASCGGNVTGTEAASLAFECTDSLGNSFSGSAAAEVGIGPYGIGAMIDLNAHGFGDGVYGYTFSQGTVSWSQEYVVRGASGVGFLQPQFSSSICEGGGFDGEANCDIHLTLLGAQIDVINASCTDGGYCIVPPPAFPLSVAFGIPFTVTITGSAGCYSVDLLGCGETELDVSDLIFTDATGNRLSGITLVAVPESPSLLFLFTIWLLVVGEILICAKKHAFQIQGRNIEPSILRIPDRPLYTQISDRSRHGEA